MLGALVGDIAGSVHEFANHRSKDFPFFAEGSDFTDDSVLTLAVAEALLDDRPPALALHDWGRRYPGRGYGGRFARWLEEGDLAPYGSYGNGAAMRVSPAALLAGTLDDALALARRVTEVTHDHEEGLKGALATAHAIFLAREGRGPGEIRHAIEMRYGYDLDRSVDSIRPGYSFDETCQRTVPEAIVCALEARDFEDAIRNAISLGGDADTLAAIAGPIAEARFGIPDDIAREGLGRLPPAMRDLLARLYRRSDWIHPLPSARPRLEAATLRRRYEAVGPIEEWPGERTFRGRLGGGWDDFLAYGPDAARWLAQALADEDDPAGLVSDYPALVALLREAWPPETWVDRES